MVDLPLPQWVTRKLGDFLALPRHYGLQVDGRWAWQKHDTMTTLMLEIFLNENEPVAIAMSNSPGRGVFDHGANSIATDIDNKKQFSRAREAAKLIRQGFIDRGIPEDTILITFTGKKGFHIWIFLEQSHPDKAIQEFQNLVFGEAGYVQKSRQVSTENPLLFTFADSVIVPGTMTPEFQSFLSERLDLLGFELRADAKLTRHAGRNDSNGMYWTIEYDKIETDPTSGLTTRTKIEQFEIRRAGNKFHMIDRVNTPTDIDNRVIDDMGGLTKVPFSLHQSRPDFYDIPIRPEDIDTIDPDVPPTDEQWETAIEIMKNLRKLTREESKVILANPKYSNPRIYIPSHRPGQDREEFNAPSPEESILRNAMMLAQINEVPCMRESLHAAQTQSGVYWRRSNLVAFLYEKGHSKGQIFAFFRDVVNDEEDNSNYGVLAYQINYWTRRSGFVKSCNAIKKGKEPSCPYSGGETCGRGCPISAIPGPKPTLPEITRRSIIDVMREVVSQGLDAHITAATREGKTTALIRAAAENKKKAVIVEPRIAIVKKTISRSLEIMLGNNLPIRAAFLPDVRSSCLYLAQKIKLHEQMHPESALNEINSLSKPSCGNCKMKSCVAQNIHPNQLYGEADIENHICGYQTVLQNEWDLVVLSDRKYNAVLSILSETQSPLATIIKNSDLIAYDEISTVIERPVISVDTRTVDKNGKETTFFSSLEGEVTCLMGYLHSKLPEFQARSNIKLNGKIVAIQKLRSWSNLVTDDVKKAMGEYNPSKGAVLYRRTLTKSEKDEFRRLAGSARREVEHHAEFRNEALNHILDAIDIGLEHEWIIHNVPTLTTPVNVQISIAPKIADTKNLLRGYEGALICMDAIPTIVPLDEAFGRSFVKYNLGAPSERELKHVIVPDDRATYAAGLKSESDRVKNTLHWMDKFFGEEGYAVLVPSKAAHELIRPWTKAEIMWHRGSGVIGVPCAHRVCVSFTPPKAPTGATNWLRIAYPNMLRNVSDEVLDAHEQAKQSMQAEGRFKDPANASRSGVFCFGHTGEMCAANYVNSVAPQRILGGTDIETETPPFPVIQLALWIKFGEIVEGAEDLESILRLLSGEVPWDPRSEAISKMLSQII